MKRSDLTLFSEDDYLDDVKEDVEHSRHSKFPIISKEKNIWDF